MSGFSNWLAAHTDTMTLWIGALCTLGLFSILYRENKIYRFFEHLFLGLSMGYLMGNIWTDTLRPKWWIPLWNDGEWWQIGVLFCGLCYYLMFFKKVSWISRLIIGFILGVSSGLAFQAFVNDYWPQIPASFKPLWPHPELRDKAGHILVKALSVPDVLNNLIFMIILVCVMSYFFFSLEQNNRVLKRSATAGRWMMMFSFGAIFGSTMMARIALLIDRLDFLINDFGPQIGGQGVMFIVLLALCAVVILLVRRNEREQE